MNKEHHNFLIAKDKRRITIQKLMTNGNGVILLRANIPGIDKHIKEAHILLRMMKTEIMRRIHVEKTTFRKENDGYSYYFLVEKNKDIKNVLIEIEDKHRLGRFVDIDYYEDAIKSISRHDLLQPMRLCYLCNNPAFVCMRNNTHTVEALQTFFIDEIRTYINQVICDIAKNVIYQELDLEDKFGLITPTSQGSHPDMDYQLMESTILIVVDACCKMFWIGYHQEKIDEAYRLSKQVGIDAEQKMFAQTKGINTYKGLIFILGLVLMATGHMLAKKGNKKDIFAYISIATKSVFNEPKYNTFGEEAWMNWQIGGARKEAALGMPTVQHAYQLLKRYQTIDDDVLHYVLGKIIVNAEDTVLLKRCQTMHRYDMIKEMIAEIKFGDNETVKKVTQYCIAENLSCGGSADLLIATLFVHTLFSII